MIQVHVSTEKRLKDFAGSAFYTENNNNNKKNFLRRQFTTNCRLPFRHNKPFLVTNVCEIIRPVAGNGALEKFLTWYSDIIALSVIFKVVL